MTTLQNDAETTKLLLSDREWRLSHLYFITNKNGVKQLFTPNWAQKQLLKECHFLNICLKARQLGITTAISLIFLDVALFNTNMSCGIIADTEENAKYIFRKIKYAYDCLPEPFKAIREAKIDSAKELTFNNNSIIRVGTSLRSATFNYLLVSEYGKVAAEDLKRANEILTGSLQTVAKGQYIFIESTARGREGAFHSLVVEAQKLRDSGKPLTELDFKFFFFPWHLHPEYFLNESVHVPEDLVKYFKELQEVHAIKLTPAQMAWYTKKAKITGDEMMLREYPSTAEEAFQASNDGCYYAKYMTKARIERRITHVAHDSNLPVYCAFDFGISDCMSIWFYQIHGTEVRLIDYIEGSEEPLTYYLKLLKEKPYIIEKVFVPHDATVRDLGSGLSRVEIARNLGVEFTILPKLSVAEGIDALRNLIGRCWFDEKRCEKGIAALEAYRKEWNETQGLWASHPHHNWASHGADSARYMAISLKKARTKENDEADYRKAIAAFHEPDHHPLYGNTQGYY